MSSFEIIQDRLTALQESTNQVKELIQRLATIKFQPGSVPLPRSLSNSTSSLASADDNEGDENNVATELSTEINQILREEEEELELLQEEILDIPAANPGTDAHHRKSRLKEGVHRLEGEIRSCHSSFRKAQLSARSNLLAAQKLERQLLLSSLSPPTSPVLSGTSSPTTNTAPTETSTTTQHQPALLQKRRLKPSHKSAPSKDASIINASTSVTDSLRRTHSMITSELSKSAFARQTLAESTEALKELQRNYEGIDSLLSKSRTLVGTLLKSQKSDTWYLQTAFYILLVTLGWLVFRRFLYGPLWWLVWFPVRTTFRTGKMVGSLGGGKGVESGGARMEIVGGQEEGYRVVGVGEEGTVPTVVVAGEDKGKGKKQRVTVEVDVDIEGEEGKESLVDKVGRIIEDNLMGEEENEGDEAEQRNESSEGGGQEKVAEGKNPMKRMWEEDLPVGGGGEGERVRDEL